MYSPPLLFEGSISEKDGDKIYKLVEQLAKY